MVRWITSRSDTLKAIGAIAQLGERLICIQEVVGSIPSGSTSLQHLVIKLIRKKQSIELL